MVPGIVLESDPPKAKGAKGQWRQMFHKDFNNAIALHRGAQTELREEKATYPWTLLAFLSGPGFVYFILNSGKVVKLALPQGAGVIFRGDVHHAGAAYDAWNLRAHWYLIPETSPNKGITEVAHWRNNDEEPPKVALHEVDPTFEWNKHSASQEPAGMVYYEPCEIPEPDDLLAGKQRAYLQI